MLPEPAAGSQGAVAEYELICLKQKRCSNPRYSQRKAAQLLARATTSSGHAAKYQLLDGDDNSGNLELG